MAKKKKPTDGDIKRIKKAVGKPSPKWVERVEKQVPKTKPKKK